MAASLKTGVILARASNCLCAALFQNSKYAIGAIPNTTFVRHRLRRKVRGTPWQVQKKVGGYVNEVTPQNDKFLKDLFAAEIINAASPLREEPWERKEYQNRTMRTGLLAVKIGVQPQWTKDGKKFLTTLLQVLDNHAIRYIPPELYAESEACKPNWRRHGLGVQVVGALSTDPFWYTKAYNNLFLEAGVPPKRKLTRFLITPDAAVQPGTPLHAHHFQVGQYVDCQAKTIGQGFQGVVRRWGFKGGPATHGSTKFQRRPGATGGGGDKSAIWKGKKMPGHMGDKWRTLRGLKIWRINPDYNVLYVTGGCLPGPTHTYVRVMDSCLPAHRQARLPYPPPMPTWVPDDSSQAFSGDIYDDELYNFAQPTISFQDVKGK